MRILMLLLVCASTTNAQVIDNLFRPRPTEITSPPEYLVHIMTDSPRDKVSTFQDWGSGALVDPEYVLTCNHNIERAHSFIEVEFTNGDIVRATVFKRVPAFDLCLLKLEKTRYETTVKLSDQERVKPSQNVTVWGYPGDGTATAESYTGRVYDAIIILGGVRRAGFRFEGMSARGVSGGPCVFEGRLVGVQTGSFPVTGIRVTNTPQVRKLLKEIP